MRSRALSIARRALLIWGGVSLVAVIATAGVLIYQARGPRRDIDESAASRMTSWSHPPVENQNSEQRMQVRGFSVNSAEFYGDLMFANFSDGLNITNVVTIRGAQLPDGSFWPYLTLEVSSDRDGPWRSIGTAHRNGTEISVTVPPSIIVSAMRVDLRPFRPYLADTPWGRVVLPTGQSALVDLKELRE